MTKYRVELERLVSQFATLYVDAKDEKSAVEIAMDLALDAHEDGGAVWHDDLQPHTMSVTRARPSAEVDRRDPDPHCEHCGVPILVGETECPRCAKID